MADQFVASPEGLYVPEIHPGVEVAHAGVEVGNVDPRFSPDAKPDWQANRAEFFGALGMTAAEVAVIGISGQRGARDNFVDMGYDHAPEEDLVTDAVITARPGIGLMMNPADCIPLTLYAPDAGVLAMVHVGFPGIDKGLHQKVLKHLVRAYDVDPGKVVAHLGPSIAPESYVRPAANISEDQRADPRWKDHIRPVGEEQFSVDFPGVVKQDLMTQGVRTISDSGKDVGSNTDYFSFDRHKAQGDDNGRNANLARMKVA
jgi:copper oxidase (laccase) domain-containing protein